MRKIGRELGVEAMSLYKHVENKEAVVSGIVDRVAGEIELPCVETARAGQWREVLRRRAHSAHEVLKRHPWAPQAFMSGVNVGPAMLRYHDRTIGVLRAAGFSFADADHAWNAIDNHIYGFTLQEVAFPFAPEEFAEQAQAYMALIPADTYPHLRGMADQIVAGEHDGVNDFAFGLELILDGLERMLDGRSPRAEPPS